MTMRAINQRIVFSLSVSSRARRKNGAFCIALPLMVTGPYAYVMASIEKDGVDRLSRSRH